MKVSILEARDVVYEGRADEVVLPGEDGELTVLDFHQPLICALKKGRLRIRPYDVDVKKRSSRPPIAISIKYGIVKVYRNELSVMIVRENKK